MRRTRMNRGFTLIEIIIVVTILAILAGLIIPRYVGRVEEARKVKAVTQIREIMKALELYRLDNGKYPSTEQGLQALVEQPASEPQPLKWRQYMDKIPKDAWGNDYIYMCPGTHGAFEIISLGPDGKEGEDDIMSWDLPED